MVRFWGFKEKSLPNDVDLRLNWVVYGCLSFSGLNWGGVNRFLPGAPSANIKEEQKNLLKIDLICHKGTNLMQVDINW